MQLNTCIQLKSGELTWINFLESKVQDMQHLQSPYSMFYCEGYTQHDMTVKRRNKFTSPQKQSPLPSLERSNQHPTRVHDVVSLPVNELANHA